MPSAVSNYDGLSTLQLNGTWVPANANSNNIMPATIDRQVRGGLRMITGEDDDILTEIPGTLLQVGMLVWVVNGYGTGTNAVAGERFWQYNTLEGESRDTTTGRLPNARANWTVFETGSTAGGLTFRGNVAINDDDTIPDEADNGDFYVNTSDGNYATDWARIIDGVTTADSGTVGDIVIYSGADDSTTYADDSWDLVATGGVTLGLWTRNATDTTLAPTNAGDDLISLGNITGQGGMIVSAGGTGNANLTLRAQGTGAVNIEATGDGTISLNENTTVTGTFNTQGNTTLGNADTDTTTISGPATCNTTLTVTGNTTLNGNTTLGNADTDTVTVTGTMTVTPNATFSNRVTADNFITTPVDLTVTSGTATPDFGASAVFNVTAAVTTMALPTNLVVGQSGIFVLTGDGAINGWNNAFHFAGGSFTAPTNPAIVPYYVQNATADSERIYIGTPTGDIHRD